MSNRNLLGLREATLNLIPHLTPSEISDLVEFLRSLNGTLVAKSLTL